MYLFEANWQQALPIRAMVSNVQLLSWLKDKGSLTEHLIAYCNSNFRVRVISEHHQKPLFSEASSLGINADQLVLVRQVELLCYGQPVVFARSLIPLSSLKGRARQLGKLGSRPLGAVLFDDPTTRRETIEYARIHSWHRLYNQATASLKNKPYELQGRRTVFRYGGQPLLVNEIFLPRICTDANGD